MVKPSGCLRYYKSMCVHSLIMSLRKPGLNVDSVSNQTQQPCSTKIYFVHFNV